MQNMTKSEDCWTRREISSCGALGPSMVAFLKEVFGQAKGADKFLKWQ